MDANVVKLLLVMEDLIGRLEHNVGNYSTDFEYNYVDDYGVLKLKSKHYFKGIPSGWNFFSY